MADLDLRPVDSLQTASATDLVFQEIYDRIIALDLPPGTKMSEAETAKAMGVSRQPVRDAFYRLSQLGFLRIRPQRATTVTRISEASVLEAQFIRTAIEIETVRAAVPALDEAGLAELDGLVAAQAEAVAAGERLRFQELDDRFHQTICRASAHDYAWSLIRDNKAHMDRVRYLSLASGAESALGDHVAIMDALRARDAERAVTVMRVHLGRIKEILAEVRAACGEDVFEGAE